jgi:hypothetical protein
LYKFSIHSINRVNGFTGRASLQVEIPTSIPDVRLLVQDTWVIKPDRRGQCMVKGYGEEQWSFEL